MFRSASANLQRNKNMADVNVTGNLNNATLNETLKNATLTGRAAATPQGLFVAYTSLVVMALLPIWYGSFKSVLFNKKQKVKNIHNCCSCSSFVLRELLQIISSRFRVIVIYSRLRRKFNIPKGSGKG